MTLLSEVSGARVRLWKGLATCSGESGGVLNSDPIAIETIENSNVVVRTVSLSRTRRTAHGFQRITRSPFLRKTRQTWRTPSVSDDEYDHGEGADTRVTSTSEPLPLGASSAANNEVLMGLTTDGRVRTRPRCAQTMMIRVARKGGELWCCTSFLTKTMVAAASLVNAQRHDLCERWVHANNPKAVAMSAVQLEVNTGVILDWP